MNKKLLGIIIPLCVVILVLGFVYFYNKNNNDITVINELDYNSNPEKIITHISSGIIKSDTMIAVRFKEDQVSSGVLEKTLDNKGVFKFEPEIEGEVFWGDRKTLVFKPDKPLLERNIYTGVLDLEKLFKGIEGIEPEKEVFSFETLGQYFSSFSADFKAVEGEEDSFVLAGELKLAEPVEEKEVKKAIELLEGSNKLAVEIIPDKGEGESKGSAFSFKSERLKRTDQKRILTLCIDDKELKLEEPFQKEFTLLPEGRLLVSRLEEEKAGNSSIIRIVFSDKLDTGIDYRGFVVLEPDIDFRVEVEENSLVLRGDFAPGQKYKLRLLPGIKSRLGMELAVSEDYELEMDISDINPAVKFSSSGMFLTSARQKKIAFRTINVSRVHLKVKKVEEENLISFFEENSYLANDNRFDYYNQYGFQRAGEILESRILEIGEEKNKWIQSELDLSSIINDRSSALYIVQLEFDEDDALYFPDDWSVWEIRNYVNRSGRKVKHLICSDLGISVMRGLEESRVFVSNVLEAEPVTNALVVLKNKENQEIEKTHTDEKGFAILRQSGEYLEVRKGYNYSVMKFKEARLDTSLFDVAGTRSKEGIKAFIYTDRGVYRPGDRVNLGVIARNKEETFPDGHPVTMKVYNPEGKNIYEETGNNGKDGFYSFNFTTETDALTGNWTIDFKIGNAVFSRIVPIEEIVPYRIEVEIEPEKEQLTAADRKIDFTLAASYLFGAPASGLESETTIRVEPYEVSFDRFKNFFFDNESIDFGVIESHQFNESLDEEGKTDISWKLPEIINVPSAVRVRVDSRVLEKGGRPVPASKIIPVDVYDRYVGIKKIENNGLQMGNNVGFDLILVSDEGELIPDQELRYRIYRMKKYWWWEYDDRSSFRSHYKTDSSTELVKEGELVSGEGAVSFNYDLKEFGEMLVEVEDLEGGHTAAYFFRSYYWGDSETASSADTINIKADKEVYYPGDTARIIARTPERGMALLTVEKGGSILYQEKRELGGGNTVFDLDIIEEYIPNAYVILSVYQPYEESINDMPVRLYGIMPLKVEKQDARLDFEVETPAEIRPGESFEVKISSKQEAQFTIAIVDEGLLGITGFKTPDPLNFFFQKERLLTDIYDTFSEIIGFSPGYIYNVFSIGGGLEDKSSYRQKQLQSAEERRFEPVALFKGPVCTDKEGKTVVSFTMPEYIGRVRVMVVGADEGTYGSKEEEIIVKSPLMVMPTLPRVLGPEDLIEVPVTVFAMEELREEVDVELKVEGPVQVVGESKKTVEFNGEDSHDLYFKIKAGMEAGQARISVGARSAEHSAVSDTNLNVRPYNPYTYLVEKKRVEAGEGDDFKIPAGGIKNTSRATLSLSLFKDLNLNHRLKWLLRYPYGCVEQTVSSVFPQLYLGQLQEMDEEDLKEIDNNVNAAIERLRSFQLGDGGFSYWPNENRVDLWSTNYVGHFLLEAGDRGYYVPAEMLEKWLEFQHNQSRKNEASYLIRTYRLYLLAKAGRENLSAMNYLRESQLEKLNNTSRYYLAAAYLLAGYDSIARELIRGLKPVPVEYETPGLTFGSRLRDKAIMLEVNTIFKDYEVAVELYDDISEKISGNDWYSTQTTAYSLMALSKYVSAVSETDEVLQGRVVLPDDELAFSINQPVINIDLDKYFDQEIRVINDSQRSFYTALVWEGVPLRGDIEEVSSNLELEVSWHDEDGRKIDHTAIEQGSSFWGIFTVRKEDYRPLNEVALVQVLPAGWEIENLRLLGGKLPEWSQDLLLGKENYLDIRDDRIMWFFDHDRYLQECSFMVKINAVTVGEYYLPPALVEVMYDNRYKATTAGQTVSVLKRANDD